MRKKEIIAELETYLPDLKKYELSEVDVTEDQPLERTRTFFNKVYALYHTLTEEEKSRCPKELNLLFRNFEHYGIHIARIDRSTQRDSLKVPEWTLIVEIGEEKFDVYTLGRVLLTEIKTAIR